MRFRKSTIPGEDIKRGLEMVNKRRELIENSDDGPIVCEFGVNRLAASLHPGYIKARIKDKKEVTKDCIRITLASLGADGRFPYFRAGQFITLCAKVRDAYLNRPYSIVSSPLDALKGKLEVIVQRKGIFSSWLIDEAQIGEELMVLDPHGDFCHDDLRDTHGVLAIAGGSGVTPFLSMMKAIEEKSEDFELTLLYGVRKREQMLADPKDFHSSRIRIIPVLSEEECEGYEHGFIDAKLIEKYRKQDEDVFLCGPDAMYSYVEKELLELGVRPSKIRRERNSIGDRAVDEVKVFDLKVHIRDEVFKVKARNDETIVTALERAGIRTNVRCRNGSCGFCHSRLIEGEYHVDEDDDFRRAADKKFGYIHPCCSYPESDLEIDVPYTE